MKRTKFDALENEVAEHNSTAAHMAALMNVLGDGRQWEHNGVVIDGGLGCTTAINPPRCACGQAIRFQFVLDHKTDKDKHAIVGCVCIDFFQQANPDAYASLKKSEAKLSEELKEQARKAKEAREQEEVERHAAPYWAAVDELSRLYRNFEARRSYSNPRPVPYWLWQWRNCEFRPAPQYQRAKSYVKWYDAQMELIRERCKEGGYNLQSAA